MKKGAVNIGDRQRGRIQAKSVINCEPTQESIAAALAQLYSKDFQASLRRVSNPYDGGDASKKIIAIIKSVNLKGIVKKRFNDLEGISE